MRRGGYRRRFRRGGDHTFLSDNSFGQRCNDRLGCFGLPRHRFVEERWEFVELRGVNRDHGFVLGRECVGWNRGDDFRQRQHDFLTGTGRWKLVLNHVLRKQREQVG